MNGAPESCSRNGLIEFHNISSGLKSIVFVRLAAGLKPVRFKAET